ncbi:unnamed protein product [Meloidogyne enterolobii]|uniref:Uncharacterized protein n=1 Tax=Meloidogyne enterolobii TaxID=390850 RepID=A0ACB0XZW3_MELEN
MVVALHGTGNWRCVADDGWSQHGWMARQHGTVDWMAQSMALVVRWLDALPSLMVALVQMDGAVWFGIHFFHQWWLACSLDLENMLIGLGGGRICLLVGSGVVFYF